MKTIATVLACSVLASGCVVAPPPIQPKPKPDTAVANGFERFAGTYSCAEAYNVYMVGPDGKGFRATLAPAGGVLGDAGYVAFQLDSTGKAFDGTSRYVCDGSTLWVTRVDGSTLSFVNGP